MSEMKRKIEILHCNYKFLIWIKNKLLLMKCGAVFGIELRSEADCEYPLDDNSLSGNEWCLIWKMTKRTKQ